MCEIGRIRLMIRTLWFIARFENSAFRCQLVRIQRRTKGLEKTQNGSLGVSIAPIRKIPQTMTLSQIADALYPVLFRFPGSFAGGWGLARPILQLTPEVGSVPPFDEFRNVSIDL